jgi:hypothetical protein
VATNKKPIWERAPASNANAVVETEVKPVAKAYSAPKYLAKTIVKPVQKTIEVSDQLTMADKNIALANAEGKIRHYILVDTCFALSSLELPNYVILEIIDWIDYLYYDGHKEKISLIEGIEKSIRKIKGSKLDE